MTSTRLGPYTTPRVRIGQIVTCAVRGRLRVSSLERLGHIVWPMGLPPEGGASRPSIIVMGDLRRALRREAAVDVAVYWGVNLQSVCRWRRALGIVHRAPWRQSDLLATLRRRAAVASPSPGPQELAARNQAIVAALVQGATITELARKYGVSKQRISRILHDRVARV